MKNRSIMQFIYLFIFIFMTGITMSAQSEVEIKKNTTGYTLIGVNSNNFNLFVGENAGLLSNATATQNVGIGDNALRSNTAGLGNTALGSGAMTENTTGLFNVAIGANTLKANTVGDSNLVIGSGGMEFSQTGSGNTYLGTFAAFRSNGANKNVGVGNSVLYSNVTGSGNVAIGNEAGFNETGSNKLYIENSLADSSQALIYGEFDNDRLRFNAQTSIYSNSTSENGIYVEKTHTGLFDVPAINGVNKVNDFYGIGVRGEGGYIGVLGLTGESGNSNYTGVVGQSTGANSGTNVGVRGFASGGAINYAIYGSSNGTANSFAGFFQGQLKISQAANEQTYFNIENESGENVLIINDDDIVEVNRFKTNWYTEMDSLVTNWYTRLTNVTATGNTSLSNVTTNGSTNLEIESGKRINKAPSMKYYIAVEGTFPAAGGQIQNGVLLSEIRLFPKFATQIAGWMPCEGQLLDILDHQALYSLIGTEYGGNGTTTFALPDMRNAVPHQN